MIAPIVKKGKKEVVEEYGGEVMLMPTLYKIYAIIRWNKRRISGEG